MYLFVVVVVVVRFVFGERCSRACMIQQERFSTVSQRRSWKKKPTPGTKHRCVMFFYFFLRMAVCYDELQYDREQTLKQ